MDVALFRLINITWGWDTLEPFMQFMSDLRMFLPAIVVLVLWMVLRDGVRGRVTVLALICLIPLTDQISATVLKPIFERPRPCREEAGIEGVRVRYRCSGRGSFPSSHATNIAGVALLLGWRYRRAAWLAALIAFLVGYSRIYLGVHYPGDVVGGWLLGLALGAGVIWLAGRGERWWHRRRPRGPDGPVSLDASPDRI